MNKGMLLWLMLALCHTALFAQFSVEKDQVTGKRGVVNPNNGEVFVPFEYDEIFMVPNDSIFIVKTDGKYGVADQSGKLIIPLQFGMLSFVGGRPGQPQLFAKVYNDDKSDNKWGMINRKGQLVIPMQYQIVNVVYPDLLVARTYRDSVLHFFDGAGKPLYDEIGTTANPGFDENTVEIIRDSGPRFYNIKKNSEPYFNDRYVGLSWTDGSIIVYGEKNKVGMMNLKGDTLLPFQFAKINAFGDGNFLVHTGDGLQGLANTKGEFLVPIAKQHIKKWQPDIESAYTVRRSGQRYQDLMDRYGKVIAADCTVNLIGSSQMHLRNTEHQWDFMRVGFDQTRKYGFFKSDGTQIVPIEYADVRFYTIQHPIIAVVTDQDDYRKSRMLAFNMKGEKILPDRFRTLYYTYNPRILIANENEKFYWGFIDLDHPNQAKFEYDGINDLTNGYYAAKNGNNFRLFDSDLKEVKIGHFTSVAQPVRQYYDQFRRQKLPGKLIALGYRPDEPTPFAINEKGQSFRFDPLPKQRVEMELANGATGSGRGKPINPGDVIEVPPPPPMVSDVEISDAVIIEQAPVKTPTSEQYKGEDFVMYPDKRPQYPGGEEALFKFIREHLQYPQAARDAKIQGIVIVTFDIEKDGSITHVRTTKGIGGGCDKEAERVVKLLPKWIPAEHNGKKVRTFFDLPVRFEL